MKIEFILQITFHCTLDILTHRKMKPKETRNLQTKHGTRKVKKGICKCQQGKRMLRNYSLDQMKKALEDVRKGMNFKGAVSKNAVLRNTLKTKFNNTYKKEKIGPETTLSEKYESDLVIWLTTCMKNGFPVTCVQLRDSPKKLVT